MHCVVGKRKVSIFQRRDILSIVLGFKKDRMIHCILLYHCWKTIQCYYGFLELTNQCSILNDSPSHEKKTQSCQLLANNHIYNL